MRSKEYKQALEKCIEWVLEDSENPVEGIDNYPQFRRQLRSDIRTVVWLRSRRIEIEPEIEFLTKSKRSLLNSLKNLPQERIQNRKTIVPRTSTKLSWFVATLIFLAVYLSGGMLLINRSLPGDRLYLVKTSLEDLRLALTLDPAEDARLHLQYAQEHLIACAKARSQGRGAEAEIALQNYERNIAGLIRATQMMPGSPFPDKKLQKINISRIYLDDLAIFKVLLPGSF